MSLFFLGFLRLAAGRKAVDFGIKFVEAKIRVSRGRRGPKLFTVLKPLTPGLSASPGLPPLCKRGAGGPRFGSFLDKF